MFCPNYKNKEVFDGFNEIVEALGGKPMTEEEFRESALRNQRTGSDYDAMEAAYEIYHLNNGNLIDQAPNGNSSVLFQSLLKEFDGDRAQAIRAKSRVYSQNFRNWFGDWTSAYRGNVEEFIQQYANLGGAIGDAIQIIINNYSLKDIKRLDFEWDKSGYYRVDQGELQIPQLFDDDHPYHKKHAQKIVLHELIHVITSKFLFQYVREKGWAYDIYGSDFKESLKVAKLTKEQVGAIETLYKLRDMTLSYIKENRDNVNLREAAPLLGQANYFEIAEGDPRLIDEFVAEVLSNPNLQVVLKQIPYKSENKTTNIFKTFVDAIKRIIGIPIENTVLEEALSAIETISEPSLKSKVSKVVDSNGEPLIVYHNSKGELIEEYDMSRVGSNGGMLYGPGIYMSTDQDYNRVFGDRQNIWYANIKRPLLQSYEPEYDGNVLEQDLFIEDVYQKTEVPEKWKQKYDGTIGDDGKRTEYVAWDSNQIKSATGNNGNFSTEDNNVNRMAVMSQAFYDIESLFDVARLPNIVSAETAAKLLDGQTISSLELVTDLLGNSVFDDSNAKLAQILLKHDIPVKLDNSIGNGTIAETVTTKNGGSMILINPDVIQDVSKNYAGISILHEIIHALTVDAINNPNTEAKSKFARANNKVFNMLRKALVGHEVLLNNSEYGLYALTNEKEFAAVYITDSQARSQINALARQIDIERNGRMVEAVKRFINAVYGLFTDKALLHTAQSELSDYRRLFDEYLRNQDGVKKGGLSKKELEILSKQQHVKTDVKEQEIEARKNIEQFMNTLEYNKLVTIKDITKEESHLDRIQQMLTTRKSAIRTSDLSIAKKQAALNTTENLLQMYENPLTPTFSALRSTITTTMPQLLSDLDKLRKDYDDGIIMSSQEYMYQYHSNFVTYEKIYDEISKMIKDKEIVTSLIEEYNKSDKIGSDITIDDIQTLQQHITNVASAIKDARTLLDIQRDAISARLIEKEASISDAIEGSEYAAMMVKNFAVDDISSVWSMIGSMDSSTNEGIRILAKMLEEANNTAHSKTLRVAGDLVQAVKKLKRGESVKDIYETYKGKTTGYAVRRVNMGHFLDDYDKFMESLNKKYGLDPENRRTPDDDSIRADWNKERNKWLAEHCERKYTPEYYEAWSEVPEIAKTALDSINNRIRNLLVEADAIDEHGYRRFDKLTDDQWKEYNRLVIERKFLYSETDIFGRKKDDEELKIVHSLVQLRNKLNPEGSDTRKRAVDAWKEAREKIIEECGGREAYERYLKAGHSISSFNDGKLIKWDLRNTTKRFSKEEGRDVFKEIEDKLAELDVIKPYYGAEDEAISEEIRKLLNPFRIQNGEVAADELTDSVKTALKKLYAQRNKLRAAAKAEDVNLRAASKAYTNLFKKYIKTVDNDYMKVIKRSMYKEFTDEDGSFNEDAFYTAMLEYGYFGGDSGGLMLSLEDSFMLSQWNRHIEAKDFEKYMDLEPGDGWIDREQESKFLNKYNPETKEGFDESFGSTMVPKESLYKNKQWDKIQNSTTLTNLHNLVIKTITDSNALQTNRQYYDNYLLPQVMASSLRRMIRAKWGFLGELIKIIKEKLGIIEDPNSYLDTGEGHSLDDYDSDAMLISRNKKIVGNYADGRSYNTIPQYYTRKLDDPSQISTDLVDMLISYYRMSALYSEKQKIKDDCEIMVDKFEQDSFLKHSGSDVTKVEGKDSNTFKYARRFLDMQMYGQWFSRYRLGNYEISTTLKTLKQYTTAVNLGLNPKVAAVGFMTSMWTHLINAVTGQKYSKKSAGEAFLEVLYRVGKNLAGIAYVANPNSNDKMMLLMEEFDVSNQGENKAKHTNRRRLIRGFFGNLTFGFLSSFDFIAKSNIMVATLKEHRYVDGQFVTRDDIEDMRVDIGEEEYNRKLKAYLSSKKNAYNVAFGKDNKLQIDKAYEDAWKNQRNLFMSRVNKYAEDADGMATPLQKALMTQNFVGMLFLIHRQYLGLMLQQRYGQRVYDYDTRQYKNAIFRTFFLYALELTKNSCFGGGVAGLALGTAISGLPGGAVGAIVGTISSLIYKSRHRGRNFKSIKQINQEFFGVDSYNIFKDIKNSKDKKKYRNQRQNKKDIKRIVAELVIYNFILQPLVDTICMFADEDDDNKWWLQMIAYWARAFQWEANAPYRPTEVLGAIRSATAATSPIDKIENITGSVIGSIMPQAWFTIFQPTGDLLRNIISLFPGMSDFTDIDNGKESYYDQELQSGAYSYNEIAAIFEDEDRGWTRREQAWFKLLPFHNLYEQFKDSKRKRQYIENQIMHIKRDGTGGNFVSDIARDYIFNSEE